MGARLAVARTPGRELRIVREWRTEAPLQTCVPAGDGSAQAARLRRLTPARRNEPLADLSPAPGAAAPSPSFTGAALLRRVRPRPGRSRRGELDGRAHRAWRSRIRARRRRSRFCLRCPQRTTHVARGPAPGDEGRR
jgi:hypothetical protein